MEGLYAAIGGIICVLIAESSKYLWRKYMHSEDLKKSLHEEVVDEHKKFIAAMTKNHARIMKDIKALQEEQIKLQVEHARCLGENIAMRERISVLEKE